MSSYKSRLPIYRMIVLGLFFVLWLLFPFFSELLLRSTATLLVGGQLIPLIISLTQKISLFAIFCLLAHGIIALLAGRLYCSFFCPLGIIQEVLGFLADHAPFRKRKRYFRQNRGIIPYAVALVSLLSFFIVSPIILIFLDPYSLYFRGYTTIVTGQLLSISSLLFWGLTLLLITAVFWKKRIFCDLLCPAGALLRPLSYHSFFSLVLDSEKCTSCGRCQRQCPVSCINIKQKHIDNGRCVRCFSCLSECPEGALSFGRGESRRYSSERRRFFSLLGASSLFWSLKRANAQQIGHAGMHSGTNASPILPPGALGANHFRRCCTGCRLCELRCPTKVLSTRASNNPLIGDLQPSLDFKRGYCDYNCNLCGSICPTGAIRELPLEEKKRVSIGYSRFHRRRCLVVAQGTACGACAEVCPVEAVVMVPWENGLTIPFIHKEMCIGCGRCEYVCPIEVGVKAITIETRSIHTKNIELTAEEKARREGVPLPSAPQEESADKKDSPFAF